MFQIFVWIFLSSSVSFFFFFLIGETEWERLESFVTENDKGILVFEMGVFWSLTWFSVKLNRQMDSGVQSVTLLIV